MDAIVKGIEGDTGADHIKHHVFLKQGEGADEVSLLIRRVAEERRGCGRCCAVER